MARAKENKKVQLFAVNAKYKIRPYFVCPVFSSKDRKYVTGLEPLSDANRGHVLKANGLSEDLKSKVFLPIDQAYFPIAHRQLLDLDNDEDFLIYSLCKINDAIASSSKTVNTGKHLFYINDTEADAEIDISRQQKEHKAKNLIFDTGDQGKLKSLCIFIGGIDIRNITPNALLAKCLEAAEKEPDNVIGFFDGKHAGQTMIKELYHHAIIQLNKGAYYDGEVYIGIMEEAINYVANPKNGDHINSLGKRLLEKKGE